MENFEIENIEIINEITTKPTQNVVYTNCQTLGLINIDRGIRRNQPKTAIISLDKTMEADLENSLHSYASIHANATIASTYVRNLIMYSLLSRKERTNIHGYDIDILKQNLDLLCSGETEGIIEAENTTPSYQQIFDLIKSLDTNLAFILNETKNSFVQQAINLYLGLSAEHGFKVTLYTTKDNFNDHTTFGNILTTPEDFVVVDVEDLIHTKNASV